MISENISFFFFFVSFFFLIKMWSLKYIHINILFGKLASECVSRLEVHIACLNNLFLIWARILSLLKSRQIEQFSKEKIIQDNISTVILIIKYLVSQWDPRHLQGSRVVYIHVFISKTKSVFYLITFLCIYCTRFLRHIGNISAI